MNEFKNELLDLLSRGVIENEAKPISDRAYKILKDIFNGSIPPSYDTFVKTIGFARVGNLLFSGGSENYRDYSNNNYENISNDYVMVMDTGDDVVWFFDKSLISELGEVYIRGIIPGLTISEQPDWLVNGETYQSFKDFFTTKVTGEKATSGD